MDENLDYTILPEDVLEKLAELSLELSEGKTFIYKKYGKPLIIIEINLFAYKSLKNQ